MSEPVIASWEPRRPRTCWDPGRAMRVPSVDLWTAAHEPCGTQLVVSGPRGSASVVVVDHGPAMPGRGYDLSPAAFEAVCGPLSAGVCEVRRG